MELFLLFVVVALVPAIIYVMTAEETDDSLSHSIPAEKSKPPVEQAQNDDRESRAFDGESSSDDASAVSSAPIVIEKRTFLGVFLQVILVFCGGIMAAALLLRMLGIVGIPDWFVTDCTHGFILAALLKLYVRSRYTIDPAKRKMWYEDVTPLYVRRREIAFEEIRAVAVRGETKGWPLLYHYHYLEFQIVLLFDDGLVLPVYDPVPATDHLFEHLERERRKALILSKILQCPFFPEHHLGDGPLRRWGAEVSRLRSISDSPDDLEKIAVESYLTSIGMRRIGPGQVKVDFTTRFEKFILAFVVAFFASTTWYLLDAEWAYLADNPRILYLIMLDCTSILVSVFGLWRFLVDEYYVFNTDASLIEFHSRWLFWKTRRVISTFGEVKEIRINRVWALLSKNLEYVAELCFPDGERVTVSDRTSSPGIPVFRALVLARLMGRHITADPDAFEFNVRNTIPPKDLPRQPSRPIGSSASTPLLLGGILPVSVDDLLPPPDSGKRRGHRRKKRK